MKSHYFRKYLIQCTDALEYNKKFFKQQKSTFIRHTIASRKNQRNSQYRTLGNIPKSSIGGIIDMILPKNFNSNSGFH